MPPAASPPSQLNPPQRVLLRHNSLQRDPGPPRPQHRPSTHNRKPTYLLRPPNPVHTLGHSVHHHIHSPAAAHERSHRTTYSPNLSQMTVHHPSGATQSAFQ